LVPLNDNERKLIVCLRQGCKIFAPAAGRAQ
jgi:hypothetical protein